MPANETARRNHDALFGERVSTLAQTDPELIEYFDNLAFDEVIGDAAALDESSDTHLRVLVQLAAILAAGGLAEFRVMATAALANAGVTPVELKELVYQSVATLAWPARMTTSASSTTSSARQASSFHCPHSRHRRPTRDSSTARPCRLASSAALKWSTRG